MSEYTFEDWCKETGNEKYLVKEYKGTVNCSGTTITSLKGAPEKVENNFECELCHNLTNLEGAPKIVGSISYFKCKNIESLEGGPEIVNWNLDCSWTSITSLKGAPKHLGGWLTFRECKHLISFEGGIHLLNKFDTDIDRDEMFAIILSDLLNGKYKPEDLKDFKKVRTIYNETVDLSQTELENYCSSKANNFGYELIPEDLKDLLMIDDFKPFRKIEE